MTLKKELAVKDSMFKKKRILIFLLFLISRTYAQQYIVAKSFVKEHKVYIRFLPSDLKAFNSCKTEGFYIRRISWNSDKMPDTSNFKNSTSYIVKCYQKDDSRWDSLLKSNDGAGFLYNLIYQPLNNKTNVDIAYGLAMLKCDLSAPIATASGLFFIDANVPAGKVAYLIQPRNLKASKEIKAIILLTNTDRDDPLKEIEKLNIQTKKREVKLKWNHKNLESDYGGYFIERSEDGKLFQILNKQPHVQIETKDEKNKKDITYIDITGEYGKTYFYRVRGLNFFGIYGNYSEVVKCSLTKPLEAFPLADSTHLIKDSILSIHWHMPLDFNLNELSGFDIRRSETINGEYIRLNNQKLPKETKSYLDNKPMATNYYKVIAFNATGDSTYSHPMMGLIPDKTPPAIPQELKGKIDSLGNVILHWKPNTEKDLRGYRIFKNNSLNEELVEITKEILVDTIFKDRVSIQTLSEEVYYAITAVDRVYNNSPYSKPIKLKRPDKIKPVDAQFLQLSHNSNAVKVKWIPSTSKDAQQYELYRVLKGAEQIKIKQWLANDTLKEFDDLQVEYGNYYQYKIKVIDDDGNFSVSTSPFHYFDSRIRRPITNFEYKIYKEKKSIQLSWKYPENELYSFIIYRAKKGESFKIIKTLKPGIHTFEDLDLNIGNEYIYKMKAVYKSGAESALSQELIVNF
ncbi:MAG TPA: hypothetical protein VFM99_08475 [Chitinophagales bacterium]|nr:hypothetical protein [Chitinophagales bacterium]